MTIDPDSDTTAEDNGKGPKFLAENSLDSLRVWVTAALVAVLIAAVAFVAYEIEPGANPKFDTPTLNSHPISQEHGGDGNSKGAVEEPYIRNVLEIPGLSPAVRACYTIRSSLSSTIIAIGFGIALGVSYFFGTFLYKKFRDSIAAERINFWSAVAKQLNKASAAELAEIVGGFTEYEKLILERRNVYWALFLRAALALLVVALIALLIASCKIEAQAGLPIITGIIAFIIGQGGDNSSQLGRVVVLASNLSRDPNDNKPSTTTSATIVTPGSATVVTPGQETKQD